MNTKCPNCHQNVGKEIKRKMSCPECSQLIFIRAGKTVTEREKEIFDWSKYMDFLVPDIESIRSKVEKELTEKFGQEPSVHDLVWGMFNYVVIRLKKFSDLNIIYENMATFLDSEGKHKHANQMRQEAFKMQIADFKDSDFYKTVKIKNAEDDFVCKACRQAASKEAISLDEAYNNPLLPVHSCTNKQCRCRFDFIFSSDYDYEEPSDNVTITIKVKKPKKKGLVSQIIDLLK